MITSSKPPLVFLILSSHIIIGLQLSAIDKKYGHDEVVKTIKEFELDKKGWSL